MRRAILALIPLFVFILAACAPVQQRHTSTPRAAAAKTPAGPMIPTDQPFASNPIAYTLTPDPAPTQLDAAPDAAINPYPYPAPDQSIITPPPPTVTLAPSPFPFPSLSPSPTIAKPTPTFPPSLMSLRIAYTANEKLWLWSMGTAAYLTDVDVDTYKVSISDDGEVIAFTRESGLWAIQRDGTGERLLVGADDFKKMEPIDPGVELSQLAWVPKTHKLIFNTRLLYDYGLAYADDLHMVDADTQKITLLLPPDQGGRFYLSPNGIHVALVTPTEIRLMNLDGNSYNTALRYPSVAIPSEFAYYAHPVWAGDSKSLMVAIPPTDVYYESTSPTAIWNISVDGGPAVVIAEIEAERGQYIEISPDFSKIAILEVINYGNSAEYYELHIADIDGSNDQLYSGCNSWFVSWQQDSERFVCQFDHSYQLGQVGSQAIFLTDKGNGFAWVSATNFLYSYSSSGYEEIRLGFIGEPSIILIGPIDGTIYYDFDQ